MPRLLATGPGGQPRVNQLPGSVSSRRPPGGHDHSVPATARELERLLNQPSAPADRADTCGAGRRGPERSGWREDRRRRGGEMLPGVRRKKYYPICFPNMARCAYQERQQWGHCLSLPGRFLFPSIPHYRCLQSALKPFVFLFGLSVLGRDSAISLATASPINSNQDWA